jgi:hypothetical protein
MATSDTSEMGFLEFRLDLRASDNDTLDRDEMVDIDGVEISHTGDLSEMASSDSDLDSLVPRAGVNLRVGVEGLLEESGGSTIEIENDIWGVWDEFSIELLVELIDVVGIDVEEGLFKGEETVELGHVEVAARFVGHFVVTGLIVLEEIDESFLDVSGVDRGTPDDFTVLGFGRGFVDGLDIWE